MKRPTSAQMLTAAEWLDVNDGENGESTDCKAIAEWLRHSANLQDKTAIIKEVAKERGITQAQVRAALAAKGES
jgi:hypothetical protein